MRLLHVIRTKGYSATRIEDICEAAGLTKGSFFHHFDSKEGLALAAADYWIERTKRSFASAPYRDHADPLDRLLAYVDFRKAMLRANCPTSPAWREPWCRRSTTRIRRCARPVTGASAATRQLWCPTSKRPCASAASQAEWTAESLALYMQATIQGAFILAKAKHSREVAAACIDHLRRYIELLFNQPRLQDHSAL